MRTRRSTMLAGLSAVLLVGLTACGSGSDTAVEPAVASVAERGSGATSATSGPSTAGTDPEDRTDRQDRPDGDDETTATTTGGAAGGRSGAGASGGGAADISKGRFELLDAVTGGVVFDGKTISVVYRNGVRYEIPYDAGNAVLGGGDPVGDLRAGESVELIGADGVLSIEPNGAVQYSGALGMTVRNADGSGQIADAQGLITIEPDGSTECIGADGVQQVNADGSASSVGDNGVLVVGADGNVAVAIGENATAGAQPAGKYSVCGVGGTVTIDLAGDVLFEFDSAELTPQAAAVVAAAATVVRGTAKGPVTVTGHTDAKGSDAYNDDLSMRRAQAVAAALQASTGGAISFQAAGKGEHQPVAPNANPDGSDNPDGRARNRRVTLTFLR